MRCPASVAIVMTCQRRARRPSARSRKLANDSPPHATGPRRASRRTRFHARAAASPIRRARSWRERTSAKQTIATARTTTAISAAVCSAGCSLVGGREQRERDDREHEVRELIPDTRDRDCEPHRARAELPRAEHRVGRGHPDRGASRRDDRERRRGLRHRHALPIAQPWQRGHPGRWEGREVEEHRGRQGRPVSPVEVAEHVEHVAVVRDARQDEDEDENDDRDRARGAEESLVRRRQPSPARCRAVRHLQEPTVRPLERAERSSRKEPAMQPGRRIVTPGTVIALIALFFALGGSAFAVGEHVQGLTIAQQRCANGSVRGVATVTGNPGQGMRQHPRYVLELGFALLAEVQLHGQGDRGPSDVDRRLRDPLRREHRTERDRERRRRVHGDERDARSGRLPDPRAGRRPGERSRRPLHGDDRLISRAVAERPRWRRRPPGAGAPPRVATKSQVISLWPGSRPSREPRFR